MNRFNTNEDLELNDYRDFCDLVVDHLPNEVFDNFENDFLDKYLEKLYSRYDNDPETNVHEHCAKIIERAYFIFHHNAQNRWRRWDYVKPEVGQWVLFRYLVEDNRFFTFKINYNHSVISKLNDVPIWYPIPKW